jgi:hypothetical protein
LSLLLPSKLKSVLFEWFKSFIFSSLSLLLIGFSSSLQEFLKRFEIYFSWFYSNIDNFPYFALYL